MTDDDQNLDQDLRDLQALDPARGAQPDAGHGAAPQALLARILDTPRDDPDPGTAARTGERHRRWPWAIGAAIAATVAAGLLVLAPWRTPEQAFATWTPTPQEVRQGELDDIAAQCAPAWDDDRWDREAVIAEERGRVTFAVVLTPAGLRHCLFVTAASTRPEARP